MKTFDVYFRDNEHEPDGERYKKWFRGEKVPVFEFEGVLKYIGFEMLNSSVRAKWQDIETDKIYYSALSLLDKILRREIEAKAYMGNQYFFLEGTFTFKKQGTVTLLIPKDETGG